MDSPSLYRDTLKRAWHTTRSHPHVWILGFLAALLGNGGEFEFVLTQFNQLSSGVLKLGESFVAMLGTGGSNIVQLVGGLLSRTSENYFLLGAVVFVLVVIIWLVVSAQGALIRAVAAHGIGSMSTLGEHFGAGSRSFWQLLGIILATRIGAFFVLAVIGVPLFVLLLYFIDPVKALFLLIFVLGIPLLIVASLITKFAVAFHMLEHKKWRAAVANSVSLFFDHWLVSIELAIILFAVNIVVGALIIILILIFAVPFMLLANFIETGLSGVFLWIGQVLAFLLLITLGSILATFQYASWTELFLKIRSKRHLSKIVRSIMGLRERFG